jgi:hypothetical protein
MTPIQDIHAEDIKAAQFVYTFAPGKLNGVKLHMKDGSVNLYENDDLAFALAKARERFGTRKPKTGIERAQ